MYMWANLLMGIELQCVCQIFHNIMLCCVHHGVYLTKGVDINIDINIVPGYTDEG